MGKITDLAPMTGAAVIDADDLITMVDASEVGAAKNKKMTFAELALWLATKITGLLDFKGVTDCSSNPNYPAASKGDFYLVSVAGKIGGASGIVVEFGDSYFATADNAGGTQAGVGTSWTVIQGNITSYLPLSGGTLTGDLVVPDEAYDAAAWNGSLEVPTKNAVRDKIEAVVAGGGGAIEVQDEGATETASLVSLNFIGAGVTATDDGSGNVDVDIPGGGGGATAQEITPTKPLASAFTLQNGGTTTLTDKTYALLCDAPSSASGALRMARANAALPSSTAWTLTAKFKPTWPMNGTNYEDAFIIRNSTSGRIITFAEDTNVSTMVAATWSSYTGFNNQIFTFTTVRNPYWPWRRIVLAAGTLDFQISPDGDAWYSMGTTPVATYINAAGGTIDELGFGTYGQGGTLCYSWTVV